MPQSPEIILCATQRCGSTLIVEDMRNSGVLGQPEEWLLSWQTAGPDVNWHRALQDVRDRATGGNGVMAVKVMANQLLQIETRLKSATTVPPGPRFHRFFHAFQSAHWIRLNRRNVVAQAISRTMARQTNVYHATRSPQDDHFAGKLLRGYSDTYNDGVAYDYDAILREVSAICLENLAWDNFFRDFGITPIEFTYEDVMADEDMRHLDRMAELVGLTTPPRRPRTMVKLGNQRNAAFETRFLQDAAEQQFRPSRSTWWTDLRQRVAARFH